MNLWQQQPTPPSVTAAMTDVIFRIKCTSLPVDHAQPLASAVIAHVPWLSEAAGAGVHPVHVAASQNGWQRPEHNDVLNVSKRTRLTIRVSTQRAEELVEAMSGQRLQVAGHDLTIESGRVRNLVPAASLFSRHVFFPDIDNLEADEAPLVEATIRWCNERDFQPYKLLCGKLQTINTDDGPLLTRSVLLADVPADRSLVIQSDGIGHQRLLGCGIVLMHKDTGPVHAGAE